ncbi:MAG TPA: hypothetical protein VK620_30980 [Bradyrhizobium sp.]|nr:hypothetical protein [Bradyrhizobium sp.]
MFDSQCDLAALVYDRDQDPDEILRQFASELTNLCRSATRFVDDLQLCEFRETFLGELGADT